MAGSFVLASLLDSVVVLGVAFDGDAVVRSVETDVHRLAVGPGDLDLVRGAVLRVALDGVGLAAAGDLQSCGLGSVGAGAGELGVPSSNTPAEPAIATPPSARAARTAIPATIINSRLFK